MRARWHRAKVINDPDLLLEGGEDELADPPYSQPTPPNYYPHSHTTQKHSLEYHEPGD